MTPVLHSKSMEYWHLPAKGFTSLLDSNLPSIYTQKLMPVPYTQKATQARTASSYELSLHGGTAACESCPLKASSSLPGPRDFPPYRGNDRVFWISGITCARKTNFFVAGKVLTWFNSPLSWQKTNLREKKKVIFCQIHELNLLTRDDISIVVRTRGEQSWKQRKGSRTAPPGTSCRAQLSHQTASSVHITVHRWAPGKGVLSCPPDYPDYVRKGTETSLVPLLPFQKGKKGRQKSVWIS